MFDQINVAIQLSFSSWLAEMIGIRTRALHHCTVSACKPFHSFCTFFFFVACTHPVSGGSSSIIIFHQCETPGRQFIATVIAPEPVDESGCTGKDAERRENAIDGLHRLTDQITGHDFIKQMQTWWRRTKQS